jgi:hypothetical protein
VLSKAVSAIAVCDAVRVDDGAALTFSESKEDEAVAEKETRLAKTRTITALHRSDSRRAALRPVPALIVGFIMAPISNSMLLHPSSTANRHWHPFLIRVKIGIKKAGYSIRGTLLFRHASNRAQHRTVACSSPRQSNFGRFNTRVSESSDLSFGEIAKILQFMGNF